ncbi:hypothetical protein TNCT_618961 [Trichonephila clavata]|uniref:Uncharacterized protein n=1 Tax=Trichonephila clavata TaxID=2740835 RepID=A0A8X6F5N3_TRICU|nr:hypothetical protein TNCT_618961 [Trichonephila clavata]
MTSSTVSGCRQSSKTLLETKPLSKCYGCCLGILSGLILHIFLNPGGTITVDKYCKEIDEIYQKLVHKRPALITMKAPKLRDKARPHVSMIIRQKLYALGY